MKAFFLSLFISGVNVTIFTFPSLLQVSLSVFLSILPFLTLLSPSSLVSSFLHSELCPPCDPTQVI